MIDVIQSEFKKIILKCCAKFDKDVALILGVNELGENTYTIIEYLYEDDQMKGFIFDGVKNMTILEVLGVKIDMLNYSGMSEPFIQKSILRYAKSYGIKHDNMSMICFPTLKPKTKKKNNEDDDEYEYVYDRQENVVYNWDVDIYLYNGRDENLCLYLETIQFSDLFNEQDIEIPTT